jgi:hypothetical protein
LRGSSALQRLAALGAVFHRSHPLGILAEIHAQCGDLAMGVRVIEQAHDEVQRTEVLLCRGELYQIEGELQSCAGAPDAEVEACFAKGSRLRVNSDCPLL